jgi:uncharacterized repeat protein (TIGR03899 family)
MIDFKDIAGLSEPLKRLIEVVAEGIGGISRPLLIRKNANAKAYEIRTIAKAIADSQKLLGPIQYESGTILIESSTITGQRMLPEAALDQRVIARMAYQEAKKQSNIEHITQYAADELREEQTIDPESPSSDWTARFFRIAEDITTDQMQMLWGKVLAGEVKKPGSYSLRTLDLLKNISQQEAEMFARVGKIAFQSATVAFVPNPDNGKYLKEHFGLSFGDFLILREIDLLAPNDLGFTYGLAEHDDTQHVLTCGNTCVVIDRQKGTPEQKLAIIAFTEIGRQLLTLVEKIPADPDYIKKFASLFRREGVSIKSGLITERQGDGFKHGNLREVSAE